MAAGTAPVLSEGLGLGARIAALLLVVVEVELGLYDSTVSPFAHGTTELLEWLNASNERNHVAIKLLVARA